MKFRRPIRRSDFFFKKKSTHNAGIKPIALCRLSSQTKPTVGNKKLVKFDSVSYKKVHITHSKKAI